MATLLDLFSKVRGFLKWERIHTDNMMFQLHYKLTSIFLLGSSLLLMATQYVGNPISCITNAAIPISTFETYCWVLATFTITRDRRDCGENAAIQSGVSSYAQTEENVKYHAYYQWVAFALFFQGLLFRLPHYLWTHWEGGRMKTLVKNLKDPIPNEDTHNDRKLLVGYFKSNLHQLNFYAYGFFICEFLNFVNVIGQLFIMNWFLGGDFATYGIEALRYNEYGVSEGCSPMAHLFPRETKCTFYDYGMSGTVQKRDGLCVLSLNATNEKIYLLQWFWFIILGTMSAFVLIHRVALLASPFYRFWRLKTKLSILSYDSIENAEMITAKCQIGDWFFLNQMSDNIDPRALKQVIKEIKSSIGVVEIE